MKDGAATVPTNPLKEKECTLMSTGGYKGVVGVDEAGRGPLAGPVVAAACYVPPDVHIDGGVVNDSKQMSEVEREAAYEALTTHPSIAWGVCVLDEKVIDKVNILEASLLAMKLAVADLEKTHCSTGGDEGGSSGTGSGKPRPDYVLVDGPYVPKEMSIEAGILISLGTKVEKERKINLNKPLSFSLFLYV